MKVRVQSQYYLSDEEMMMVEDKKRTWWIMHLGKSVGEGRDETTFINLRGEGLGEQDLLGNKRLDVVINLEPGRYLAGCGDKNVMGDRGFPARQLLNFLVFPNGVVEYRKYNEMPSFDEFQQMLIDDPTLSEPAQGLETFGASGGTYERFPGNNSRWCEMKATFTDDNDTCDFFDVRYTGGNTLCENCLYGTVLYRDTSDEVDG